MTDEFRVVGGLTLEELKDVKGRFRTNLFLEFNKNNWEQYPPIYTMADTDRRGCISARRVYLESIDEYEAAIKLVGSWQHWKKLCNIKLFVDGPPEGRSGGWEGLKEWRKEKELRDKSRARDLLWKAAEEGNVSAQRTLYDPKEPVGRPSKDKVRKAANEQAEQERILNEGLKRVRLAAVNGKAKDAAPAGNY